MRTFVVYARRSPEVLLRVVLMLRHRAGLVDQMNLERVGNPEVLRMSIQIDVDNEQAARLEANLYKLVDVLLVESTDRAQSLGLEAVAELRTSPMKVIYVVTTGGTIEKGYSEPTGSVSNLESKMDRYLRQLRLYSSEIRVVPLLNKDSLDMTDSDRRLILGTVTALLDENAPIVITHGTDTLVQTGLLLRHAINGLKVPIILTGAMVPLGFDGSDALQNLTESLFAARILIPGVYVVIHGEMFPIYRVRKDRDAGRFVWTDENLM
jgi:L-asparaginase